MKFFSGMVCLVCVALTFGCEDLTSFEINEKSEDVIVQGGPTIVDLPVNIFPNMPLDINLKQELESQNVSVAEGVFLQGLQLEITDTAIDGSDDEDNFNFVNSVTVYVESTKSGSSLKKQKVAEVTAVGDGLTTLPLSTQDNVNLKPYIEEGMRLISEGNASVPEDNVSLLADVTLRVEVL